MNIVMPSLRNDFQAVETYRPKPGMTLDCPVTALIGSADPRTSSGQARAWSSVTTGRFALRQFAGGPALLDDGRRDAPGGDQPRLLRQLCRMGGVLDRGAGPELFLELAGHPVVVGDDPHLIGLARQRGWPVSPRARPGPQAPG
jgi:hypothetical protein